MWRIIFMAMARSLWYSELESVWLGATTIDSPVCMPSGSRFSMLQTVMQLSYLSRTTSYSISFHPFSDFSTRICGEKENASSACRSSCSSLSQNPDPSPPKAYAARSITGYPRASAARFTSSMLLHASLLMVLTPISSRRFTKRSRSSVSMTACTGVPITRTPYLSSTPRRNSSTPQLRAVCPPNDSSMPSGRSLAMMRSTKSGSTGWKYTLSAMPVDVCTVAMFGFMRIVSMPSSFRAFKACEPL